MMFYSHNLLLFTSLVGFICFQTNVAFGATLLPDDEVLALEEIAKTIGKIIWNFSAGPCGKEWGWANVNPVKEFEDAVTCDCTFFNNTVCHVVSIVLKDQSLPGILPKEIIKLPYLQELDLSRNYLSGTIPPEWGTTQLVNISLLETRLTGPIPKEIGNFPLSQACNIFDVVEFNQLSGPLPAELGNLPNIQRLLITSNHFSGELPATFAKMTTLTDVRIGDNLFTGKIPNLIQNWTNMDKLVIQASGLDGPIPEGIAFLTKLTDLRISDLSGTEGPFPRLVNMKNLKTLILRSCNLIGPIPDYLENMKKLQTIDLRLNKLIGTIPRTNYNLTKVHTTYFTKNKSSISVGMVAGIVVGVSVTVFLLCIIWWKFCRKKERMGHDSSLMKAHYALTGSGNDFVSSPTEPKSLGNSRSWFTYEEIVVATNGFSAQNVLGEGGFGLVYKGCLPNGRDIAVKQLKIGGGQGEREFKTEVEIISRIHHRHLVSLVGYCIAGNQRLLIYEYVPNDTLYFHLHGEGQAVMDWGRRVRVAAGAAHGIAYLHEDCHPRIIHRDIKSSNILLDSNFEARVSDFGLAKLVMDANTHITTRVMGTFGYMDPEHASSGKLADKSDVYSFGVVLLELITGRKSVDSSQPLGDESLVEWARPLLNDALDNEELDTLADPRLGKNYVRSEMLQMIEAAAACVRHSATKRPRMGQVVRALDSMAPADLTNGMRPGESRVFNPEQQSADIRLFRRMAFGDQNYSTSFFSHSSLNSEVDIERSAVGKSEDL